ncbi:hypothetical protein GCM10010191_59580 [Actinomadura vinacea]|uniref:Uncharacterized protein n=2 Tax=Actinomadura vinacea TaxID=115336 RepID=A0ABN3JPQ7_9ACTN
MQRLESAVWPLAGGTACTFVLAVVLKEAGWQVAFAVVATSVAGRALLAPPIVGAALGAVAWTFVTSFDVNKSGDLTLTGAGDTARAATLITLGLIAASAGKWFTSRSIP